MAHHPLSMSNWPKWELCPCARSGGPATEEAKSGTRSHSWLQYLIDFNAGLPTVRPEGVTADERARAEWAYGEISAIFGSYVPQSEQRVTIHGHGELDGISGTADAIGILPDCILVVDYKTYSTNACDLTAQPVGYGIAVATSDPFAPKVIETVILHGGSREVERKTFTLDEAIERAHRIIRTHLDEAENTDTATPNHFCQYCPRLQTCPGADRALAVVKDDLTFARLSLAEQLVVAKQVKSICERVEKQVKSQLDKQLKAGLDVDEAVVSGGEVKWRYVLKPGNDKLSNIVGLVEKVAELGVDNGALMSLCNISKTSICDKLVEVNAGMSASEAKRIIKPYYQPGNPSKWLERIA